MTNLPRFILFFIFFTSLVLASVFTFKLYKAGRIDFLVFDKISVFSEVPGVKAQLNNKEDLEKLLDYLDFWEGVTPDNMTTSRNSFEPEKLVVHITDDEYAETWFKGVDGHYQFSAKAEGNGKTFHLYLGFNKKLFNDHDEDYLSVLADPIIIESLYARTREIKGSADRDLIGLREAKSETESYIRLAKD